MYKQVPCVVMRGGTSKSLVFAESDLPEDAERRDRVILAAFGSPDPRQIDGLGGADPLTSKLAIVAPSERDDADVDYTFGQVGIASASINYQVTCGNTAAAVAVYAVEQGLVAPSGDLVPVRMFCRNNSKTIVGHVPMKAGRVASEGDYRISGVPTPGAKVLVSFVDPAGGATGDLLPTGSPVGEIELGRGRHFRFSLVDCGNLYAILPAESIGLSGVELPDEIDSRPGLKPLVEEIREAIADRFVARIGTESDLTQHAAKLKMAVVGPPVTHKAIGGDEINGAAIDIVARVINQERTHKAFAVTGAISFAAAASIPGSIVNVLCRDRVADRFGLRIGHPQGIIDPIVESNSSEGSFRIAAVHVGRTARRIMQGLVYVPGSLY